MGPAIWRATPKDSTRTIRRSNDKGLAARASIDFIRVGMHPGVDLALEPDGASF
jgi:hypothetical protein